MRMRFHTRSIIRDGHRVFVGSQSLREAELDRRRELGFIKASSRALLVWLKRS
jgi:hypothetical protein